MMAVTRAIIKPMKNNRQRIDNCISLLAAGLSTVLYFVMLRKLLPTPIYSNDQLFFKAIVSGTYTGSPDGHVIYPMYLCGLILSGLYRLFPSVGWYDLWALSSYPLGCFLTSLCVSMQVKRKAFKVLFSFAVSLLFYVCTAYFYVQNEYTVCAGILAAVGILCFSASLQKEHGKLFGILFVFCLTGTLWTRKEVFWMAVPLLILVLFRGWLNKKLNRTIRITILALVLLTAGSFLTEKAAYSSAEWKDYQVYNEARTAIFDYDGLPDDMDVIKACEEIGVTETEYRALGEEFGLVKSVDSEKLSSIADITGTSFTEKLHTDYGQLFRVLFLDLKELVKQPVGLYVLFLWGLILLLWLIRWGKKRNKSPEGFLFASLGILYDLAFSIFFLLLGRFPERVYVPLGYMVCAYEAGVLITEIRKASLEEEKFMTRMTGLILFFFLGTEAVLVPKRTKLAVASWYWNEENIQMTDAMMELCLENTENTYYFSGRLAQCLADFADPGKEFSIPGNFCSYYYWIQDSPLQKERFSNLGLEDMTGAMADREDFYYAAYEGEDLDWLTDLMQYYGYEISLEQVDSLETVKGMVLIYRIFN